MEREQITIRLPADLKERIQREADYMGISFNSRIVQLVKKGFILEEEFLR